MKASVTRTERLNMRSRAGSRLAAMKASISGWSQRSVPIMAPRREPADMMVRHMESQTSMKLKGPEASAPTPRTGAPLGRSVEKSWPMPPPCCMVRAASFSPSKIPSIESGTAPMTKQLNRVTRRPVPAPARIRPAGRKRWFSMTAWNSCSQKARRSGSSAAASARATRCQVAAIDASSGAPPSDLRRYLRSQISCEIGSAAADGGVMAVWPGAVFSICTLTISARSFNSGERQAVAGAQALGSRFELAAGGEDVAAAGGAHRARIAGAVQHRGEALDGLAIGALIGGTRPGIERDEVDLGGDAPEQLDQALGVVEAVIDALEHHIFEGDAPGVGQARIGAAGRQQRIDRIFAV